jgi:hypothetical protein
MHACHTEVSVADHLDPGAPHRPPPGGIPVALRFSFDSRPHMEQWGAFEVFPQSVGQDAPFRGATSALNAIQHIARAFGTTFWVALGLIPLAVAAQPLETQTTIGGAS